MNFTAYTQFDYSFSSAVPGGGHSISKLRSSAQAFLFQVTHCCSSLGTTRYSLTNCDTYSLHRVLGSAPRFPYSWI